MNLRIIKKEKNIKDDKGHKILAAIYLVTNHLSDSDPLVLGLRTHAVKLIASLQYHADHTAFQERGAHGKILVQLLQTAFVIGSISEKNASIISYEIQKFVAQEEDSIEELFTTTPLFQKDIKKTYHSPIMSYRSQQKDRVQPETDTLYKKNNDRTTRIVSFMQEKKSATIKDIAALFPGVSEKTIQRDLGGLVQLGNISKRGNKRWSVYFYEVSKTL